MLALLIFAFGLIVAGAVMSGLPAVLALTGVLLGVVALMADPARLKGKRR